MEFIPTYDDTNAVGNVYFANYMRWVGKARELFFNECMPDFDLSTTSYYVVTKSFYHEFRREAKEFEEVLVRIRIAGNNRKFVTLRHEIVSAGRGILGRGEQSIMFVDTQSFQPLDVPRAIVEGFLPYWPKNSPFAVSHRADSA
jgi:YbgC/YbaW family acyl-CoA thioester hydrolase